jgi:hypothetical protein
MAFIAEGAYALIRSHNLDSRVGSASGSEIKYRQILELRKDILKSLIIRNWNDRPTLKALSLFLFDRWREIYRQFPSLGREYLTLAKSVYWPVPITGGKGLKALSMFLGPVNAIKIKDILK